MSDFTRKPLSRRQFLTLAGGTLAAAGLAACGAPAATEAPTAAPTAAAAQATAVPTAAPPSGETLKMWWWGEQEAPGVEKWLNDAIAQFQQETGNSVEATLQDTGVVITEFQTASAANSAPDIQFMWNGIYHMESAWLGYVEPLDDLLGADFVKSTNPTSLSTYQGKTYRLSWYSCAPCWVYNKEMFDQAGLNADEAPTTWEGFLDACDKLKSKGFTPIVAGLKDGPWGEWYMGTGLGPNLDSPADAINLFIGDLDWREPRYYEHWSKLAQLWQAGFINDDMNSIDLYPGIDMYGAGKGAMTAIVVPLIGSQAKLLGEEKVGAMIFPAGGQGKMNGKPIADFSGLGISSQSKNKEVAGEFLKFLHDPSRVSGIWKDAAALPSDTNWDGNTEITDPLLKDVWKTWVVNPDAVPYISNLMPTLFWTDAMFVNSQKIISGEYTGEQAGENAHTVSQKWREQNPDLVEKYSIWAKDLQL